MTQLDGDALILQRLRRSFYASTGAAGISLIAPQLAGGHPTLWNPANSGIAMSIRRVMFAYALADNAPTALEWALTPNTGDNIGTAKPVVTFTQLTPVCSLIGHSGAPKGRFSVANSFVADPVFTCTLGISQFTGVAATAVAPYQLQVIYNEGELAMSPGTALSLCAQQASTTCKYQITLWWEELPLS